MRLVGCIRVSRVAGREGESFISPQQQRDRIEAHAAGGGHTIVAWHEDLDQPGTRMDRPGLEQAMLQIERGEADGIAVAKLDRFARSVPGAAKALQRLEDAGGVLVAVDLGMDTSTPAGKLMRNVLLALAEFEVDRIRENWIDASNRAIARGVHVSRVAPYGYQRGPDGRFVTDPVAAPLVRELFVMRARGEGWKKLAAYLDEHDPKPGGGKWPATTVGGMIPRRTYLGEAFQGDVVNDQAHEAIVDRDLFERAQHSHRPPVKRGAEALLTGIMRCAGCGYLMSRAGDGARGYISYRCKGRWAVGDCPEPAKISLLRADGYVTEQFLAFAADTSARDDRLTIDTERSVAAVEQAEAELIGYRDGNLISIIGDRAYREGLEIRARRIDTERAALALLRRHDDATLLGTLNIADEWERLTIDQRRQLVAAAIDAVWIRRAHLKGRAPFEHRIHISWAGTAPPDLPGRRHTAFKPFAFPND